MRLMAAIQKAGNLSKWYGFGKFVAPLGMALLATMATSVPGSASDQLDAQQPPSLNSEEVVSRSLDQERITQFDAMVREYLLRNPEVILEVFAILERQENEKKVVATTALLADHRSALFESGDARKGVEAPAVTFVEFFDYRCTYCKRAFPEISAALEGRTDVAMVLKEFPILGPQSEAASRTALAVRALHGDAAYLTIHDAFMQHAGEFTDRDLARLVEVAGFDPVAVQARSQGGDIAEIIRGNKALAAKLGVNGTPAFVFEDNIAPGMMSADQIVDEITRIAARK